MCVYGAGVVSRFLSFAPTPTPDESVNVALAMLGSLFPRHTTAPRWPTAASILVVACTKTLTRSLRAGDGSF